MGKTEDIPSTSSEPNYDELRTAPRFTLLIRSAKLICESGEYLCVVRDVSETGVRLRLFHPMPRGERVTLELASGESYLVEKVWEQGDQAGFRFADPIELDRFVAETSPYPKRPVRLRMQFPAIVKADGETAPAVVRDISQHGMRIETTRALAMGQRVKLVAEGLPEDLYGTVCWRSVPTYGLALKQVFTFEELAKLAERLQSADGPPVQWEIERPARHA